MDYKTALEAASGIAKKSGEMQSVLSLDGENWEMVPETTGIDLEFEDFAMFVQFLPDGSRNYIFMNPDKDKAIAFMSQGSKKSMIHVPLTLNIQKSGLKKPRRSAV